MERGESKPIIVLEHVSKSFDGRSIVKDVSLSLHEGELFGLIGPSGSGKTTILRTIMGFYAPDEGRVLFKGVPVKNVDDLTREVGFATQDECFYDDLTCESSCRHRRRCVLRTLIVERISNALMVFVLEHRYPLTNAQ